MGLQLLPQNGLVTIYSVGEATITATTVFGRPVVNDVAPVVRNNRTMLPIRFVAENLGARVDWIADTQNIIITAA